MTEKLLMTYGMMIYNLAILSGTAWLVVEHNWSMWTFLLALCFMVSVKSGDKQ